MLTAGPAGPGRAVAHPQGPVRHGRRGPAVRDHGDARGHRRCRCAALLPTCEELTRLFDRHGYTDSVIFGHAKDGNIHFMLTEQLGAGASLDRFAAFTEDMVDLVLDQGGSLKAEHGTGRVMAPYVRRQYGDELYDGDARDQAAVRPARRAQPGRHHHRRRRSDT